MLEQRLDEVGEGITGGEHDGHRGNHLEGANDGDSRYDRGSANGDEWANEYDGTSEGDGANEASVAGSDFGNKKEDD